jgi:ribosome biogenesis protein BMS1
LDDDIPIGDDADEVYGDFEDLETGEQFSANGRVPQSNVDDDDDDDDDDNDDDDDDEEDAYDDEGDDDDDDDGQESRRYRQSEGVEDDGEDDDDEEVQRLRKKLELKQQFNSEYDDDEQESSSFFEETRARMARQAKMDAAEFSSEDPAMQVLLRGYASGAYVRMEINNVPCEFIEHFDPHYPIIVGGLASQEETMGFLQVRIKRHRWHRKVLKNKDPLIFSLGWRRFQAIPIYSLANDAMRHRMVKYTPEHMHCYATFYGPITPPNTGFLCVQTLSDEVSSFRICATGVVLELNTRCVSE